MALRFRHEIARLAVEGAVAAHRRAAIHARILASLQALGCDDDARLAFHAEAAGDGPAALRYASAAARRAAALASHREAAAQFERALRFTDGADPATVAGLYDGLRLRGIAAGPLAGRRPTPASGRSACGARWATGCARATRCAGLPTRCGSLSRGGEGIAAGRAAIALLEPLGPTDELAWAYASLAGDADAAPRQRRGDRAGPPGPGDRRAAGPDRGAQRRAEHRGVCRPGDGRGVGGPAAPGPGHRAGRPARGQAGPGLREPALLLRRRPGLGNRRAVLRRGRRLLRRP